MRQLILLSLLAAAPAHAWGPAVHIMEADAALDRLLEGQPEWAALADAHPMARSYLRLGALSPDFQWLTDALPFGHGKALSYHLLDAAPEDRPELKLFALGHLAHNASDAVAETFFGPHAWASHPIGYRDLLTGVHDDGEGEVELVCEALGDLTLASWDPVVDLLYDFYLEDEDARARGAAAVRWYCEQGVEHTGTPLDCEAVTAAVLARLATAEELVGGLNREGAKRVVNALLDQPLDQLVGVALDGPLAGALGERAGEPSPTYEWELRAIAQGPETSDELWATYPDAFADLAPAWVEARLADRRPGFPNWNPNALVAANWLSSLRFDPERFAPHQGLIPDQIEWRVDGLAGEVDVRLFAAVPYAGEVRAVVRVDNATDLDGLGPSVAEARAPLDVDPRDYGAAERLTLTVPFQADWALWPTAFGFTLSLHHGDDPLPFFTTDADAVWSSPVPGKDRPVMREVFRTYGGDFPRSLPHPEPPATGRLTVVSRLQGLAYPVSGITATVGPQVVDTGVDGLARFALPAGETEVLLTGHGSIGPPRREAVQIEPGGQAWLEVDVPYLVGVAVPAFTQRCLPVNRGISPAAPGAVIRWRAHAVLADDTPVTEPAALTADSLCLWPEDSPRPDALADGARVQVVATPEFGRHGTGVTARSGSARVDLSPPEWQVQVGPPPACAAPGEAPTRTVALAVSDPHSGVPTADYRLNDGGWTALVEDTLTVPADQPLALDARATNGAGLDEVFRIEVDGAEVPPCPAPDLGVPDAGAPDAGSPVEAPSAASGGCQAAPSVPPLAGFTLALLGLLRRRRSAGD